MNFLIDSHCHIHDNAYQLDSDIVLANAKNANVRQLICVGTSGLDSQVAADYVRNKPGLWASAGLHPHDAKLGEDDLEIIARLAVEPKVVAIGECGLDYHYDNSPREEQIKALEYQLQLALSFNKPCVFHVREAFSDFWPILDNFSGIKGVVHSFSSTTENMVQATNRGLLLGLNGIMTFTKDAEQKAVARQIPLDNILLETDSPFLTPAPLRGTINEPANVRLVAAYLAELRGNALEELIQATTNNAQKLFSLTNEQL